MTSQSLMVWLVRDHGLDIYKDGKLVGTVPVSSFPLLISDLAIAIAYSSTASRA